MDVYYSKRPAGGIVPPKKRQVTALKDANASRGATPQLCNRIGCCGRVNHTTGTKNKCLEKPKPWKPTFRSSSSKEVVVASSSKNRSSLTNVKKSPSLKKETTSTESTSVSASDESEVQKVNPLGNRKLKSRITESSSSRVRKVCSEKYSVVNRDSRSGSSSSPSSAAPGIINQRVMENTQKSDKSSKYGLKSLKCNSISDVYKQGEENKELSNGRRRRLIQGESSSSSKGKRVIGVSANESGNSISDTRNSRSSTACKASGISSVRTRRSLNVDTAKGNINRVRGHNLSVVRSNNVVPETSHSETNCETSSNDDTSTMISVNSTEDPVVHFMNHRTRHYNIDGMADVLLALDRIEQDEELTYEQLLSLEANLFLGGLNYFDQHRDMRLDIDNMSYEELLALEEKMGTVSTALSEEELSKCIRVSIYESLQLEDGRRRCSLGADDIKCSICQEEFFGGDEIGRLRCGHGYHNQCINQWLSLKNWCPICKASPQSVPA